ncbi:MAG: pyridoxal-phosphate dependent enzyme [bacterium]
MIARPCIFPTDHTPRPKNLRALSKHTSKLTLIGHKTGLPAALFQVKLKWLATGDNVYYIPGGGSSPTGALGYVNAAFEIVRQFEEANEPFPEVIVVAAGTAGTYAGILLGLRWLGLATRVVGVRVVERFVCNRALVIHLAHQTADLLRSYGASGVPNITSADVDLDHHQLGAGYGLSTDRGMHAIGIASRANGLVLEPTAKAFGSIIAHRKAWRGKRILYWHTLSGVDLSGRDYDPSDLPPMYSEFLEAM